MISNFPFTSLLQTTGMAGLLLAAVTDLDQRIIPNKLVAGVLAIGLLLQLQTPNLILASVAGALIVFFALGVLGHFNLIGGGDVKLIAATTLLVSPRSVLDLLLTIALAGGLLSCVYLALRAGLGKRELAVSSLGRAPSDSAHRGLFGREAARIMCGEPMPYAIAILFGVTFTIASEVF